MYVLVVLHAVQKKFGLGSDIRFVFENDGTLLEDLDLPVLLAIAEQKYVIQVLNCWWPAMDSRRVCGMLFVINWITIGNVPKIMRQGSLLQKRLARVKVQCKCTL
jgi:hypothetical protein